MFTGIVQHVGRVAAVEPRPDGRRLLIDPAGWIHQPATGDSIAIDGCCLTLAEPIDPDSSGPWPFDVIAHTARLTTLGSLEPGRPVNLEHAATPETMLGGHVVQGHIDGVGRVIDITDSADDRRLRIAPDPDLMESVIERGSIAVAGVSLTIADVGNDWFEIALIPTTRRETTLGRLAVDDRLNIEVDYIARIVTTWLRRYHAPVSAR